MMIGVLIILIFFLMVLVFLTGVVLLLTGQFRKEKSPKLVRAGMIIAGIPAGIVALILLVALFNEIFSSKPDAKELAGKYRITEVTVPDFDGPYSEFILQLNEDGSFTMTPTPFISECKSGRYRIDYDRSLNELSLDCGEGGTNAHIERGFGSHRIAFIIGDPDSNESIYFEKVKD